MIQRHYFYFQERNKKIIRISKIICSVISKTGSNYVSEKLYINEINDSPISIHTENLSEVASAAAIKVIHEISSMRFCNEKI